MWRNACQPVLAFALLGALAGPAAAQTVAPELEATGVVARADDRDSVTTLNDGRMLRATPATLIMAAGQPGTVSSLRAGTMVVIHSADPTPDAARTLTQGDTAIVDVMIVPPPAVR